jgi:hypothetical protein
MLDHVFLAVIGALRKALEDGFLERHVLEERFQADILLGDLTWETSYSLPGEGTPPRVRADVGLDWPTWSQSAYRSWSIGESADDVPEVGIEIVLRVQRLASEPDIGTILAVLPDQTPGVGQESLERASPTLERTYTPAGPGAVAIEVSYEGTYRFDDEVMEDITRLDSHFAPLGAWVASTLVRLCDLKLPFLPPDPEENP